VNQLLNYPANFIGQMALDLKCRRQQKQIQWRRLCSHLRHSVPQLDCFLVAVSAKIFKSLVCNGCKRGWLVEALADLPKCFQSIQRSA
jgi:hypothetical protein